MIERRSRRRIVSVTLTLPWLVRIVRLLFYCCCYCYCCGYDVTTASATVLLSSLSSTTTTTTTTTTKPRIRGSILISGNSSKVIEKDNGLSSDSVNTNTAHETFNISRSSNSNNREKMKKKKKKKKDKPNKQQMMMTLIEEEQRLLWRNETPLDDFFSNDNDNDNDNDSSSTQNNFSNENYQSEDSNRNSSNYNGNSKVTTTDSLDIEYEDENDDEGDEEIMTLLEVEELLFVGNDSFDDDVVDTKGNENEEKSFDGSNNNNDSNIDNDNSKGSNNEDENENEKLDCLWKVITGTGCTSVSDGDIIGGYQHMYLNADGGCHYNDFLGYYRAGCAGSKSRSSSSSSQSDQQEQEQEQAQQSIEPQRKERLGIPPPYDFVTATTTTTKTKNENTYDKSSRNKATIKLQHVFCADPTCSIGCLQESVIRPQIHYTSHFCYTSGFYDGGQPGYGFDDEDIDDDNFDSYSADYNDNQKKSVDADIQNTRYQFSFEFVGSCDIQNEMCNIIE